jgi:hypothetical protein
MKYRVFDTEEQALAAEAQVALDIGCAKVGVNAKTGQPEPDKQVTERWAIPQQIVDGRWVFLSPDDVGVEADDAWWPTVTEMEAT